jgi:hypothetical protein
MPASAHDASSAWKERHVEKQGRRRNFQNSSHTGPKGVLNDYKAHKRGKAEERKRNEGYRAAVLARVAKGHVEPRLADTTTVTTMNRNSHGFKSEEDSDSFSDDDGGLMNDYYVKRMAEMKIAQAAWLKWCVLNTQNRHIS